MAKKKYSYYDAVAWAENRNASILSPESAYQDVNSKLSWLCSEGHEFWQSFYNVYYHACWCTRCTINVQEEICRFFLEQMFGKKFPSTRPIWCVNSKGKRLELDGYNEELLLAFEHNGLQHYRICKALNIDDDQEKLARRQDNDMQKQQLCHLHQVRLIIIPEMLSHIGVNKLEQFIIEQLKNIPHLLGRIVKRNISIKEYIPRIKSNDKLQEAQHLAESKGGQCLSKTYIAAVSPLEWICEHGHKWPTSLHNIKSGSWCPVCAWQRFVDSIQNNKYTYSEAQKICHDLGWELLTRAYKNGTTKVQVRHYMCNTIQYKTLSGIIANSGCRNCAIQKASQRYRLQNEQLQEFAKSINCIVDNTGYINNTTPIEWLCLTCNFKWMISYAAMCQRKRRKTICKHCHRKLKVGL